MSPHWQRHCVRPRSIVEHINSSGSIGFNRSRLFYCTLRGDAVCFASFTLLLYSLQFACIVHSSATVIVALYFASFTTLLCSLHSAFSFTVLLYSLHSAQCYCTCCTAVARTTTERSHTRFTLLHSDVAKKSSGVLL